MVSVYSWNSAESNPRFRCACLQHHFLQFQHHNGVADNSGRMVTTGPVGTSALAVSRSSRPEFGDLAIFVPRCRKAPWADLGFGAFVVLSHVVSVPLMYSPRRAQGDTHSKAEEHFGPVCEGEGERGER